MSNKLFKQLDYDKISDDICLLGINTILRFNVILSRANHDGTRNHFHKEFEYSSNKYIDTNKLITMRRSFDFYLSIENFKNNDAGYKEFITIRIQDILYVRAQLNEVTKWFNDIAYANLFVKRNNKVIVLENVNPIFISGLSGEKYLMIEPTVIEFPNDVTVPGVRIFLASDKIYTDLTIDRFMGFVYLIQSINMYESAQLLINYLQRPDLGTGLYTYERSNGYGCNNQIPDEDKEGVNVKEGRVVETKKKKQSFVDKIDKL